MNELGSAILDIKNNKVYITGFMSEKMLQLYLNKGAKNWSSQGLYDDEDLEFNNIKDDALIIVREDRKEIGRHQYRHEAKKKIEFKNEKGKKVSRTVIIRKSVYSNHYHFYFVVDKEKESDEEKKSLLFDNKDALNDFLKEKFNFQI